MGCDIHIVLEKKFGDRWVGVKDVNNFLNWQQEGDDKKWKQGHVWNRARSRDYAAFGMLANVRWQRDDHPEPKGMPDDASELARVLCEQMDSDGHSHSYCSLREFFEAKVAAMEKPAEVFLTEGHPALTHPMGFFFGDYEPEEDEEYRVVFWFDN